MTGRVALVTELGPTDGPFLLEWLAYHRAIGIDDIFVAETAGEAETRALLTALAARDLVIDLTTEGEADPIDDLLDHLRGETDWALYLAPDEFLAIRAGDGTLADLLAGLEDADGMLIARRLIGDGGRRGLPERLIDPGTRLAATRATMPDRSVRTLFRLSEAVTGFGAGRHRPALRPGSGHLDFRNGSGRPINTRNARHAAWLDGTDAAGNAKVPPRDAGWDVAEIARHAVRSPDLLALSLAGSGPVPRDKAVSAYRQLNRQDTVDTAPTRWQASVDAALAEMRVDPAVAAADAACRTALAGRLEAIDGDAALATVARPVLTLPDDAASAVRDAYAEAGAILEYGSGGSTFLAAELGVAQVFSVESDPRWAQMMQDALAGHGLARPGVRIWHADIGETGAWGRPKDSRGWRNFHAYPTSVWSDPDFTDPDVILIDGRFRAACLLYAAARLRRPAVVLFDDYADRPAYHRVEEVCRPSRMFGRMARFDLAPGPVSPRHLDLLLLSCTDPN